MGNFPSIFSGTGMFQKPKGHEHGVYENLVSFKTVDKFDFNPNSLIESILLESDIFDDDIKDVSQSLYLGELDETPDIIMEGAKDIAKSAKEFFKRILKKFREFMKKFYMYMYSHLGSFDKFILKYKKELNELKPDFYIQGHEYNTKVRFPDLMDVEELVEDFNSGISRISGNTIKEEEKKLANKTSTDVSAKIRGNIIGVPSIEKGEFTETVRNKLRSGNEDPKEIHVDSTYLKKALIQYKDIKDRLNEYKKEENKIDRMINTIIRIFSNGPSVDLSSSGERVYKISTLSRDDGKIREDKDNTSQYEITENNARLVNKFYSIMYARLNEYSSLIMLAMSEKVKATREELKQTEKIVRRSLMSKAKKEDLQGSLECGLVYHNDHNRLMVENNNLLVAKMNYVNALKGSGVLDAESILGSTNDFDLDGTNLRNNRFDMDSVTDYTDSNSSTMLELKIDQSLETLRYNHHMIESTLSDVSEPDSVLEAGAAKKIASGAKGGIEKTKEFFRKIYEFIKNIIARFKEKVQSLQNNVKWVTERQDQFNKLDYDNINVELVPYWEGDINGSVTRFINEIKLNNVQNMNNKDDVKNLSDRETFIETVLGKYTPKNGELVDGLKDLMRVGDVNGSDPVKLTGSSLRGIVTKHMIPGVVNYDEAVKTLTDTERLVDNELKVIEREMTKREMDLDKSVTESALNLINTIYESLSHVLPVSILEAEEPAKNASTTEDDKKDSPNTKTSSNAKENKKVEVEVVDKEIASADKASTELYKDKGGNELKMMRNVVHFQQLALTSMMTILEERNVVYNNTLRSIWNELNTVGRTQSKAEKKVDKERNK